MRKVILCVCVILSTAFKPVSAGESGTANSEARLENYISSVYNQIDFSKCGRLSFEAFDKAYHGYLNLLDAGKLNAAKEIISICDFSLSSAENRLWIIDLAAKKVLFNTYVAHGQGSGDEFAVSFSNRNESHQSSLGFYVTGDTYDGEHGTSLRLAGMDQGFNDAAFDRGIVVHGADYVCDKYVCANQRLGRSWGCPAVPAKLSLPIINTIKDGTCLFIYYPDSRYTKSAYWMNKKATIPQTALYASVLPAALTTPKPARTIVQYMNHGKIDSVKEVHQPTAPALPVGRTGIHHPCLNYL